VEGLSDPDGSNAIVAAVAWLQGTLLGTVATTVAIIAVASVGFAMLTGRTDWRHAARVVIGCFILLGASSIVAGIRTTVAASALSYGGPSLEAPPPLVIPTLPPVRSPPASDPYAGAAVPPR
jgi:type IV secretion system protein VirB2